MRNTANIATAKMVVLGFIFLASSFRAFADIRPIKLVQREGWVQWTSEDLKALQESCFFAKNAVGQYPAILTDGYIRQHGGGRRTRWYDGKKQAEFHASTTFVVDFTQGCNILAVHSYSAVVQADCTYKYSATNLPGAGLAFSTPEKGRNACFLDKEQRTFVETYKKTELEDGTSCLLNPISQPGNGIRHCLYPLVPFYMGHSGRPVDFLVGHDEKDIKKARWLALEELRDGDIEVPPNIFTEQAVRDWVNRPTTEVLQ